MKFSCMVPQSLNRLNWENWALITKYHINVVWEKRVYATFVCIASGYIFIITLTDFIMQWFSSRVVGGFCHIENMWKGGDIFSCHSLWGGACYEQLIERGMGCCCWTFYNAQDSSTTKNTWPKMSTVMWLRI